MRRRDAVERFWEKVERTDGCWLWTAALHRGGYGKFKVRSYVTVPAHRFAYEMNVGPIPDGMFVCHRCDNPTCVRPDHLFIGTPTDNVHDMLAKGRDRHWSGPLGRRGELLTRAERTHCFRGHELNEANALRRNGGRWTQCRACVRERYHARMARLRTATKTIAA